MKEEEYRAYLDELFEAHEASFKQKTGRQHLLLISLVAGCLLAICLLVRFVSDKTTTLLPEDEKVEFVNQKDKQHARNEVCTN